jgi:TIR domain
MPTPRKVFVSYSHHQGDWVWDRLVPVLKAGRAQVLIDRERFEAGRGLLGQMDATQDAADVNALVLSPDYLASDPCCHEMERAIARDPRFEHGFVVPVKRVEVELPAAIRHPNPLYVDLSDDGIAERWDQLLHACGADLGTDAPAWIEARDEIRRFLERGQSVNLVVGGDVRWRELLEELQKGKLADLAQVNLEKGTTASRRGLVEEILRAFGMTAAVPSAPEDLVELDHLLSSRRLSRLILTHFDLAAHRQTYGVDLFAALRFMVMESRQLVLLVQSRRPFATLLPAGNPLSEINLQTVVLRGRR